MIIPDYLTPEQKRLYEELLRLCKPTYEGSYLDLDMDTGFDVEPLDVIRLEQEGLITVRYIDTYRDAYSIVEERNREKRPDIDQISEPKSYGSHG